MKFCVIIFRRAIGGNKSGCYWLKYRVYLEVCFVENISEALEHTVSTNNYQNINQKIHDCELSTTMP